jgi:hypothetical protein
MFTRITIAGKAVSVATKVACPVLVTAHKVAIPLESTAIRKRHEVAT